MKESLLGIGIRGVIMPRSGNIAPVKYAFDRLGAMNLEPGRRFTNRIHVVSCCSPEVQIEIELWLLKKFFYAATGISHANVHFCRERSQKAGICHNLGITHFVDGRLEVLGYLRGIVSERFVFDPLVQEVHEYAQYLEGVEKVYNWADLQRILEKKSVTV